MPAVLPADSARDADRPDPGRRERFSHFLARECQVILEIVVVVSLIATVVTMATVYMFAIIPAAILLVSYGLLMVANHVEKKTNDAPPTAETDEVVAAATKAGRSVTHDASGIADRVVHEDLTETERTGQYQVSLAVRHRLTRVTLYILTGVVAIALVLAWTALPGEVLALGIFVLSAYILAVSAPVWLAWLERDMEDEVEHQRDVRHMQ